MKATSDHLSNFVVSISMGIFVIFVTWGLEKIVGLVYPPAQPTIFNAGMIVPCMGLWGFYSNKTMPVREAIMPLLPRAVKICVACYFVSSVFAVTKFRLPMFGVTAAIAMSAVIPIGRIVQAKKHEDQ